MTYVVDGRTCSGETLDVSATGMFIVSDDVPATGETLVVEITTRDGEVLDLHGRVAGLRRPGKGSAPRPSGFSFALDAYNEAYENLVLALSTRPAGSSRARKADPVADTRTAEPPLADAGLVRILLVGTSDQVDLLFREAVSKIEIGSFRVEWIEGAREALAALAQRRHEIAFVSWRVPRSEGRSLIQRALAAGCEIPLVLLANVHDRELELGALREGAADTMDLGHLDPASLERTIRSSLERARAQAARRASEQELQDLFDKAPCGYLVLDERGVILRINETALGWLGAKRAALVGSKTFADLLEPGSVTRYHEVVRWFLEAGRLRDLSFDLHTANGTLLPVSVSAALETSPGQPARSRWTLLDMTERRERDAALRRLSRAIDTLQLGVLITDLFDSILYVNSAYAAALGYRPDELVGTDAGLLLPADHRDGATPKRLKAGSRWKRDTRHLRKDGRSFPVHTVSNVVADDFGAPFAVVTCCEEQSADAEKLAKKARAAREELVEKLGTAEATIRTLSSLLLEQLTDDEKP